MTLRQRPGTFNSRISECRLYSRTIRRLHFRGARYDGAVTWRFLHARTTLFFRIP